VLHSFRLALADHEALARSRRFLAELGIATHEFQFTEARAAYRAMRAIRTNTRAAFDEITAAIAWPAAADKTDAWHRGFAAGIFDAEGSHSRGILRIANSDPEIIDQTSQSLRVLGFDAVVEAARGNRDRPVANVRIRGGLPARLRFFHVAGPAITRKWDLEGTAIKTPRDLRVVSIEPLATQELFDITTGTADFIANGVVSHNCYARPSHEYLDMGAGTDFDTKIVVKRRAPELLREAFEKPSWRGEQVMFSGVTDCYQPAEAELQLTRQCLEVCLEYRNPVGLISKSALVLRDLGLLAELAKECGLHVAVSVAFADAEPARAIEPWAPAPATRFRVIEALAKAGVPVGVMCAPVMPGLNDDQMVRVLERAREAGATTAHWVLLRLPGAVATVFEERVRTAMPLAADKILHRIRETRGGEKLYDPRFGARMRGEGVYAQTLAALFDATVTRLGFAHRGEHRQMTSRFQRPEKPKAQLSLF
jgi:DNA repair photolyase